MPTVFIFHLSLQEVGVGRGRREQPGPSSPSDQGRPTSGVPHFHLLLPGPALGPLPGSSLLNKRRAYEGTRVSNLQPWANPRRMRTRFGMMGFEVAVGRTVRAMPRQEGPLVLRPQQAWPPSPGVSESWTRPECCSLEGNRGKGLYAKVKTRVWECAGQGIQSAVPSVIGLYIPP